WEHLTVRLCAGSLALQGVWYNAHRSREGEWCPADQVPREEGPSRRIQAFVAINGHGVYPRVGRVWRLFGLANDMMSDQGRVWRPRRILRLCGQEWGSSWLQVPSRGCTLPCSSPGVSGRATELVQQTSPAAPCSRCLATELQAAVTSTGLMDQQGGVWDGERTALRPGQGESGVHVGVEPEVEVEEDLSPWQLFSGCWGTSESPRCQGWFWRAEPPVSRTFWQRLLLPCAPEVQRVTWDALGDRRVLRQHF
ncbi:hypothetical protein V8C86DRAFT_2623844, partial [Haematococcus lacustris]